MIRTGKIVGLIMILWTLAACRSDLKDDVNGFAEIEEKLRSEFGKDAYYTEINISYDEPLGLYFSATVTKDPSSLQMEEWHWNTMKGWYQTSTITLEISGEGAVPTDFMFDLNGKVSIKKMGELVETAKKKLEDEKNIEPVLSLAVVDAPSDGDKSKIDYFITCKPKTGGTTFNFNYDLGGRETRFDY